MRILLKILYLTVTISVFGDSIWDDNYADIYSRNVSYKVGDSIKIIIDENQRISYKSDTKSTKMNNIDIKGGEISAVVDFLPTGNVSETKSSKDNDDINISTTIVATIESIDEGRVSLSGIKQITLNNKQSRVAIAGVANMRNIYNMSIMSQDMQSLTLNVSTLINNDKTIINDNDIIDDINNVDATGDMISAPAVKLSDEKKRALYLEYINKLLNLVY